MKNLMKLLVASFCVLVILPFFNHIAIILKYPHRTGKARNRLEKVSKYLEKHGIVDYDLEYYDYNDCFSLCILDTEIWDLDWSTNIPLAVLDIDFTHVRDLTPLSCQSNTLTRLSANVTLITDLSPLASCINLEELHISDTMIDSMASIANLSLQDLDIRGTGIDDLTLINTNRLKHVRFSIDRYLSWEGMSRIRNNKEISVGPLTDRDESWQMFDKYYSNPTSKAGKEIQSIWECNNRAKYFPSSKFYRLKK